MSTHNKTESDRFKGPVKWCQYVFARLLISLLQRLPIGSAYRLGRKVGWLCWKLMPRRRDIVAKNLEIVNASNVVKLKEESDMANSEISIQDSSLSPIRHSPSLPLETQVREVFQRAGANLFAGFTFTLMKLEEAAQHIEIEGIEYLKSSLAEGKGSIILLAHMGPWEVLAQLPELAYCQGIKAPFGAMYRPLNNTYLDDWIQLQREANQARLFSRRDGFHKPVDFLRGGGMLGILADQKMRQGPKGVYFGREVSSSPIPGLFHRRTGAGFLTLSIETVAPAKWRISIKPVNLSGLDGEVTREAYSSVCNKTLEQTLSHSILDGFWFHKRFN